MRRIMIMSMLSAILMATAAMAQDDTATTDTDTRTEAVAAEVTRGYLRDERVAIRPQVGAMVFRDQLDATATRGAVGATVDVNLAKMITPGWASWLYFGPSVGAIVSHVGNPTSNFIGTGAGASGQLGSEGANSMLIPLDLKVGYNIADGFRASVYGGGNILYRSVPASMLIGNASSWAIFPNVGADLEFALGQNVALGLRPDYTFTPTNGIFTGTVALNFAIG